MYSFIADEEKETEELVNMEFVKRSEVKKDAHHKKCEGITKNTQLSTRPLLFKTTTTTMNGLQFQIVMRFKT